MRSRMVLIVVSLMAALAGTIVCTSSQANTIKTQPNCKIVRFPLVSVGRVFFENSMPPFMEQWPKRKTGIDARGNVAAPDGALTVLSAEYAKGDYMSRLLLLKRGSLQGLDLAGSRFDAANIKYLACLRGLKMLRLTGCPVNDVDVQKIIASQLELSEIDLGYTNITDGGVATLGKLHNLSVCSLHRDVFSHCGLQYLGRLRQLRYLDLGESTLSDSDLPTIASISGISVLNLSKTRISDKGIRSLSSLKSLQKLDLSGTSLTDNGLASLIQGCPEIEELNLSNTNISNAGVSQLAGLKKLKKLWLRDLLCVNDNAVPILVKMNCLIDLEIQGTNITTAGVGALARSLPDAEVHSKSNCACRKWSRVS